MKLRLKLSSNPTSPTRSHTSDSESTPSREQSPISKKLPNPTARCFLHLPSLSRNRSSKQGSTSTSPNTTTNSLGSPILRKPSPGSSPPPPPPRGRDDPMPATSSQASIQEYKQIFDQFDANRDGKISAEEVKAILQSLGDESMTLEAAERMVEEADSDGDGFIDLQEFIDLNRRWDAEVMSTEELTDVFHIFDLDRNGHITAEELHTVLTRLGDHRTTFEDCRRMITRVDHKGLGHVDFDDFKLMMRS